MTTARRRGSGTKPARIRRVALPIFTGGRVIQTTRGWQAIVNGQRIGAPCYDRMVAQRAVTHAMFGPSPTDEWWDIWTDAQTEYFEQQIWKDEHHD